MHGRHDASASCLPCIPGRANNLPGQRACAVCPQNTFADDPEATVCRACGVGQKTPGNGSASCQPCPAGEAGTPCAVCAEGQFRTSAMGASSCAPCPAGFSQNVAGQAACLPCIPGRANNLEGQRACPWCGKKTYTDAPEATNLSLIHI